MPQTTVIPVDDEVMDFSSRRKSFRFRVDADVFDAAPDIPAELAIRFADLTASLENNEVGTPEDQIKVMHELIRMVLFPESAERFIVRLSDPANPIGSNKINDIIKWLFEEYGLRPTTPDADSSTGSGNQDTGTSLTATS